MTDNTPAPFASPGLAEELRGRHARVISALEAQGETTLVAVRDHTITYLTGYTTMTWKMYSRPVIAVLSTDGRLWLIAAETEADSARLRIPGADVRSYVELEKPSAGQVLPDGRIQFAPAAARVLAEVLEEAGGGSVAVDGLDAAWPPIGQMTSLVPGLPARSRNASHLIWELRLRKSPWELDRMREAADVLGRAYELLRERVKPGMTEREIARHFIIAQWESGAHEVSSLGVVAGPERGLFGFPTDKVWVASELLYVDGAALVDGYWSDFCRTFAARTASTDEADGYARVRRGLDEGVSVAKVGMTAGEVGLAMAHAMQTAPTEVGFGRFGHGIGLHVPEPPSLHQDDDTPLAAGMTICVEPTVVHVGVNYVVEEEHVLTADGFAPLSAPTPNQILTL